MSIERITKTWLLTTAVAGITGVLLAGISDMALSAGPPPQVSISNTPLTTVVPTHPQVLIALTNSNSMDSSDNVVDDGNVLLTSDAAHSSIMTWSGYNNPSIVSLQQSTSPVNYTIPPGFTPPLGTGTAPPGHAPYNTTIDSWTKTGFNTGGNYWGCIHNDVNPPWLLANPGTLGTFPPTGWDATQTWYYNGDLSNGNNGFWGPGGAAPPSAMVYRKTTERLAVNSATPAYGISAINPATMLLGLNNLSYLISSDGTGGGGAPHPNSTGGLPPPPPPPPPPCGPGSIPFVTCPPPPPPTYCDLWQWYPPWSTPYSNTYYYQGDNAPSRLNIAKASITSVISAYAGTADFGLMDYSVTGSSWYQTWAYYMSPPGGFTFHAFYTAPSGGIQNVINPCYLATSWVSVYCNSMVPELTAANPGLNTVNLKNASHKYMDVSARGDDPTINDVFLSNVSNFTNYQVFIEDGTITPVNPYPANYTLGDYNAGNVLEIYSNSAPSVSWNNSMYTFPTNAGYVAYTPQVMYASRGYLQAGNVSATTGKVLVPVSTAGNNPTPAQITTFVAQFTPFMVPENNVPGSDPNYNNFKDAIFANAGQSPIAGMLSKALATYGGPPGGPCPPTRYVILMTDGLPTLDLAGNKWPPLGSDAAAGFGVSATYNGDGSLNTTNDQALTDTISQLAALKAADVKTFVIGMGPGVDPTLNPQAAAALTAMAVAGGTGSASPTGYFPGTNPSAVVADLNAILNIISVANVSAVPAATNSSSLNSGTVVYQASYSGLSGAWHDWTGDIQSFPVNASTGVVSTIANWSAQCQVDILATGSAGCPSTPGTGAGWDTARLIATWNPSTNTAVPFRLASLDAAQQTVLNTDPDTGLSDGLASNRLNYLRGDTTNETHNSGTFRDRSHILGDIVDSAPLFIGPSNGPYTTDPSYQTFTASTASRTPMLYAGANDGMLHAFDATTGNEKFAFIPNGVFSKLNMLTASTYNLDHQFFVDGPPSAGDVKFSNNTWHTLLVGGLNDGGQSIYALDVTNPAAITNETNLSSSVLWEFTDANLGLTYSRPVLAKTNVTGVANANPNGFLVFFGSGYNNASGDDYVYAVNPETGRLVSSIDLCTAVPGACSSTAANGLSSAVVINSGGNVSQPVDTLYAGDLQGNLWRVNISDPDPTNWTVSVLFQARDASNNPQPITVTPAVSLAPTFPITTGTVVYFGTGQYLGIPDLTTTNTQSFYGVLDNGSGSTVTRAQLVHQVLTDTTLGASDVRTISNNSVNWNTQLGWYMDLGSAVVSSPATDAGERVITDPRLYNGEVVFTTYVPAALASCTAGGDSYLMAVNYTNGGSFPQPQLDINGDLILNSNDQVGGLNPVGIGLGAVFASAPVILSTSLGSIQAMKLTTLSTGTIMNVGERGGQPGRRSWWQIQ